MARRKTTARKKTTAPHETVAKRARDKARIKAALADPNADAFSIPAFCARHSISLAFFYKVRDQMPPSFHIGKRHLISRESAARWRAERDAAAATNNE